MPSLAGFIRVAESIAAMSKDPSTKVGAIALDNDWNILSTGWNGFPRGVIDLPDRYEEKFSKYRLISHAEQNLVAQAARNGVALKGSTAIITSLPPCTACTKSLIQAGVAKVVFPLPSENMSDTWLEEWKWSKTMLHEAGVDIVTYDYDEIHKDD